MDTLILNLDYAIGKNNIHLETVFHTQTNSQKFPLNAVIHTLDTAGAALTCENIALEAGSIQNLTMFKGG
jgi:ribulose-5-phosphate 4-epimerase/fuculose-1-phosphate aldolase